MSKFHLTTLNIAIAEHPSGISCAKIYEQFPQSLSAKSTILSRIVKTAMQDVNTKEKIDYDSFPKLFAADEAYTIYFEVENTTGQGIHLAGVINIE